MYNPLALDFDFIVITMYAYYCYILHAALAFAIAFVPIKINKQHETGRGECRTCGGHWQNF